MKLLLDTHIWLWMLQKHDKLGRAVRRHVESAKTELYLSPVSIWEAHHLKRGKRLRITQSFPEWLEQVLSRVPLREAPFNFAVATAASGLELPQSDFGTFYWPRPLWCSTSHW